MGLHFEHQPPPVDLDELHLRGHLEPTVLIGHLEVNDGVQDPLLLH
jgi:hypothetical protein